MTSSTQFPHFTADINQLRENDQQRRPHDVQYSDYVSRYGHWNPVSKPLNLNFRARLMPRPATSRAPTGLWRRKAVRGLVVRGAVTAAIVTSPRLMYSILQSLGIVAVVVSATTTTTTYPALGRLAMAKAALVVVAPWLGWTYMLVSGLLTADVCVFVCRDGGHSLSLPLRWTGELEEDELPERIYDFPVMMGFVKTFQWVVGMVPMFLLWCFAQITGHKMPPRSTKRIVKKFGGDYSC